MPENFKRPSTDDLFDGYNHFMSGSAGVGPEITGVPPSGVSFFSSPADELSDVGNLTVGELSKKLDAEQRKGEKPLVRVGVSKKSWREFLDNF